MRVLSWEARDPHGRRDAPGPFHWDCKWRAQQQGWVDYFGFPDQTRAAREFGFDCFRSWVEEEVSPIAIAIDPAAIADTSEAKAVLA